MLQRHRHVGLEPRDTVTFWKDCPRCDGRGTLCINPWALSFESLTRIQNHRQCPTCVEARGYYREHGNSMDGFTPSWRAEG